MKRGAGRGKTNGGATEGKGRRSRMPSLSCKVRTVLADRCGQKRLSRRTTRGARAWMRTAAVSALKAAPGTPVSVPKEPDFVGSTSFACARMRAKMQ